MSLEQKKKKKKKEKKEKKRQFSVNRIFPVMCNIMDAASEPRRTAF